MLQNEYVDVKIGFDTVENERRNVCAASLGSLGSLAPPDSFDMKLL